MSSLVTIITEDDLKRFACGELDEEIASEIEALVEQDETAKERLEYFRKAYERGEVQRKEKKTMSKMNEEIQTKIGTLATDARQAVEKRTNRRALIGGLSIAAVLGAIAVIALVTGVGNDIIAALPTFFVLDGSV